MRSKIIAPTRDSARMRAEGERAVIFDRKTWENRGQGKFLRGYRICVRQYNQGRDANFYLEAWGDSIHGKPAPSIGRTISGRGAEARNRAISEALALSLTGLYTEQ